MQEKKRNYHRPFPAWRPGPAAGACPGQPASSASLWVAGNPRALLSAIGSNQSLPHLLWRRLLPLSGKGTGSVGGTCKTTGWSQPQLYFQR